MGGVEGKISFGHFWKHGKSILNMHSLLDIAYRNCLGENSTIQDLRKYFNKKLKIED